MKRKVVRVTRSPMNAQRWCLELECGHEAWVTAKSEPKRASADCSQCATKTECVSECAEEKAGNRTAPCAYNCERAK